MEIDSVVQQIRLRCLRAAVLQVEKGRVAIKAILCLIIWDFLDFININQDVLKLKIMYLLEAIQ